MFGGNNPGLAISVTMLAVALAAIALIKLLL
jgi:hypothetical protein